MGRITSKLPSTHPSYCAILPVTDTANHYVTTLASGSNAAVLATPADRDTVGRTFTIHLAGRVTLYSGSSPGNFNLTIQQNNSTPQVVKTLTLALPASASGTVLPFVLTANGRYDSKSQTLHCVVSGTAGNGSNNVFISPTAVFLASAVAPTALSFSGYYNFSVAPSSGTTVEITEFVL